MSDPAPEPSTPTVQGNENELLSQLERNHIIALVNDFFNMPEPLRDAHNPGPYSTLIVEQRIASGTTLLPVTDEIIAEGSSCQICLQTYAIGGSIRRIRACGHDYCEQCLTEWLRQSAFCPICRARVGQTPQNIS